MTATLSDGRILEADSHQSLPGDTWGGTLHDLRHVAERAPIHFALGDHEDEDHEEMDQRTLPLLRDQGEGGERWHAT